MLTAADIMTKKIHTVHPDTEITALAKKFVEYNVNAMPVVDDSREAWWGWLPRRILSSRTNLCISLR